MRNEKKIKFLQKQVENLTAKNTSLKEEIKRLETELEVDKSSLLSKEKTIESEMAAIELQKIKYQQMIDETKELQDTLKLMIEKARESKNRFDKKIKKGIKNMKHEK